MIDKVLEYLQIKVNNFIAKEKELQRAEVQEGRDAQEKGFVKLGELSLLSESDHDLKECVILSLVYTEEESALKNISTYYRDGDILGYRVPSTYLNLGIVFAANFKKNYKTALDLISCVVKFFQSRSRFSFSEDPVEFETQSDSPDVLVLSEEEIRNFEVEVEMMKLSLEEINHLWGILKVRALPFVMFKVRVVRIESTTQRGDNKPILSTQVAESQHK